MRMKAEVVKWIEDDLLVEGCTTDERVAAILNEKMGTTTDPLEARYIASTLGFKVSGRFVYLPVKVAA